MSGKKDIAAALAWYLEAGVDEALDEVPRNRLQEEPSKTQEAASSLSARTALPSPASEEDRASPLWQPGAESLPGVGVALEAARTAAAGADTLTALFDAIRAFDGCALKKTATTTVIYRGNPAAKVMVIGEGPGAEEDRTGKPFVGRAGQLLDKMLAAIDLSEDQIFITNVVFWRPPGNRNPTPEELLLLAPFVERMITLLSPKLVILLGAVASKSLLASGEGIMKLHGRRSQLAFLPAGTGPAVLPTFHPAYLLRQPAHKRLAWRDLLIAKAFLDQHPE